MKNLILIGMPGAGKSTVGVVLAKQQDVTSVVENPRGFYVTVAFSE